MAPRRIGDHLYDLGLVQAWFAANLAYDVARVGIAFGLYILAVLGRQRVAGLMALATLLGALLILPLDARYVQRQRAAFAAGQTGPRGRGLRLLDHAVALAEAVTLVAVLVS